MRRLLPFLLACLIAPAVAAAPDPAAAAQETGYELRYRLDLSAAPQPAVVKLTVRQKSHRLRRLRFTASKQFRDFSSPSGLTRNGDELVWEVPEQGGTLSWVSPISHARRAGERDAWLGKDWALFRGSDVFPAMASVALRGSTSRASLRVTLPPDWSFVAPFKKEGDVYRIDNPERRFDRPTGWMVAGKLGVRIDRIAGVLVKVAAPQGSGTRRQDILAMLNWVLPDMLRVLPDFPRTLVIASADDPFWRGGLSGPASLFLHSSRPMISENGTSTLVHELFHTGFRRAAGPRSDWIVEGLAEYYSVKLLHRSGTTSAGRYAKTMASLERWGKKAPRLDTRSSSGAVTARAVGVLQRLDDEIQLRSDGEHDLDDVVRLLAADDGPLDLAGLRAAVTAVCGEESEVLREADGAAAQR